MSDEYAISGLVTAAVGGLYDGQRVSIRLACEPDWIEVAEINMGKFGASVVYARRAADGHTILFPAGQLVGVNLGASPQ